MDKTKGWIKLYRSIEDHWLWQNEKFNYQSAWIDLLIMVNHEPKKIKIANSIVEIKPGQRWTSIRQLGQRWQWKEEKVLRFLRLLESDGMIYKESNSRGTLLTIVNYEDFQVSENTLGNTKGNTNRTHKGSPHGTPQGTQQGDKQEVKNDTRMNKNEKEKLGGDFE